nr:FAD:protein FMN transferase [Robiginitalea sp. SC105]
MLASPCVRGQQESLVTVRRVERLMGTQVTVTVTAENEEIGFIHIEEALAEIRAVEKRISSWDPDSETSAINAQAGIRPVPISRELFSLLSRAVQISELTSGAFDITYAALDTLWRIDGSMAQIPDREDVAAVLPLVGYRQLVLDREAQTAFLPKKGMRISLGGIGRGYAVDRAKDRMLDKQVPGGTINAGGDITAWGTRVTGDKWLLGISDPLNIGQVLKWIPLIESSVSIVRANSQFVRRGETSYGHILDPATGFPVPGIQEVTVLARTAELSDALATALCVLGPERGIRLIEYLGDTEAIIVDSDGIMYWTSGLELDRE